MSIKISKKIITTYLLKDIKSNGLGRKPKVEIWRIMKAIIYRLKTGCQWRELPVNIFFDKVTISWNTVYYYFNKWSKQGFMKSIWQQLLSLNTALLDLSSIQLDGSHTPAKRGGLAVAYQGRKKAKTTNALFLTDRKGIPLAMSKPQAGNQNDLFQIEASVSEMLKDCQAAHINTSHLFMNADAGFDSHLFRKFCYQNDLIANIDFNKRNAKNTDRNYLFDSLLYKHRFVVERTNAWIDAYKALIIRFETRIDTWSSLHYLAFCLILIKSKTNHF
jgi:transposase